MKKIFNFSFIFSSIGIQISIFIFSSLIIFLLSYIVGYRYLLGNTFWGNDSFSYFSVVEYFNRYFPNFPFWFPNQGGGISILAGYPWFAALLVILLERITSFDLVQSFRLLGFLSIPLTGVGVFCMAWAMLREVKPVFLRQLIGLVAGSIYVVSPIAWIWLVRWGFYSENISHVFVPFAIIFFDLFLEKVNEKKFDFVFRLSLLMSVLFLTLGTLTHFFVAAGLIPIFGLLVLLKIKNIKSNFWYLVGFAILFVGMFSFRGYSYYYYNKQVAKGGFTGYAAPSQATYDEVAKNMLPPLMMLSLEPPKYDIEDFVNFSRSTIADMSFPFYVWALVVPVLLFSFFKSKKMFLFALYTLIGFFLNTIVNLRIFIGENLGPLSIILTLTTGRVFFIAMACIIPLLSAYGAYVLWGLIFDFLLKAFKKIKVIYYLFYPIHLSLVVVLTLATFSYMVFRWYNNPYNKVTANVGAFNDKLDLRDIWHKVPAPNYAIDNLEVVNSDSPETLANFDYMNSICLKKDADFYTEDNICRYFWDRENLKAQTALSVIPGDEIILKARKECKNYLNDPQLEYCLAFYLPILEQLKFENWEKFSVSRDVSGELSNLAKEFKLLPNTPYRFDMSGFTGRYIMASFLVTDNSLIQSYINTLSLIYNLWNYQSQAMYTKFPLYQKPNVLSEIAKWYGIKYVYLTGDKQEPLEDYQNDPNWMKIGDNPSGWMEFVQDISLTTWDNRPKVLVISDNSKYFYNQTFKFFTWGGLNYDKAVPVMGSKYVDDYSISELTKFEAIYMRGYGYRSKNKAYSLLDKYIKNGGKLIFDTGWQYLVPDYEVKKAPSFMPFESLTWEKLDTNSKFVIDDQDISENINTDEFGPLVWEGLPWGVSVANKIRPWAKPILSYDDRPLVVAGDYGKGKVIWYGFNIIPHAEGKDSLEEVNFFAEVVNKYIFSSSTDQFNIKYERLNPDKIRFVFNEDTSKASGLYFRESYYPTWKAKLLQGKKTQKLNVYSAGPGFMFVILPEVKKGDRLILEIKKSPLEIISELISITTLILLVSYLFFPKSVVKIKDKLSEMVARYTPKIRGRVKIKRPSWIGDNEDESY